jgi:hypothetical protein
VKVFPFIEAEQVSEHNVKRACELFEVSRSAYYQQKTGAKSRRERVDAQLTERITAVHAVSKGTYGAPRIHADLAQAGLRHGRKRIARLMRVAGLAGKSPRRWPTTTITDPNAGKRPDLVRRDFTTDPTAADTRWCGHITYITSWAGPSPTTSRPTWSTPPCPTLSPGAGPPPDWSFIPIAAVSTPVPNTLVSPRPTAFACRSAVVDSAGTTRSPSRSSPPSRPSYCTGSPGPPIPPPARQYSNTSKVGTTPAADTPASATSAPPHSKPPIRTGNRRPGRPD